MRAQENRDGPLLFGPVPVFAIPLSPLMGALFLDALDRAMEATGLVCVRFMDDWVILAPTRWKLRRAVRIVNQTLAELLVQQHPDKTFIGRISPGFDFLGYRFQAAGTGPADCGAIRRTSVPAL